MGASFPLVAGEELAPMGRSYRRFFYGFAVSDSTTMSNT
jgi:hypothetical protein